MFTLVFTALRMPNRSGYEPLRQEESQTQHAEETPTARSRGRPRRPRMGSIDLSSLDSAFKQWTVAIASKLKLQKKAKGWTQWLVLVSLTKPLQAGPSRKKIWRSVFEPVGVQTVDPNPVKTLDHKPPMTQAEFDS